MRAQRKFGSLTRSNSTSCCYNSRGLVWSLPLVVGTTRTRGSALTHQVGDILEPLLPAIAPKPPHGILGSMMQVNLRKRVCKARNSNAWAGHSAETTHALTCSALTLHRALHDPTWA